MLSPAWENLDAFLSPDEFATVAELQLQNGTTRQVRGIYDEPFLNAELGEYDLDTTRPRLLCKASDLVGVKRGDALVINGQTLDILTAPQADGTGMATLDLAPRMGGS